MRLYYRVCRFFARCFCLLMCRPRYFGRRNVPGEGGALLACNHQSFMDPVLATASLDREACFMARDTLFKHPLFARLIRSLNAFAVRRGSADSGAIKETLRRLKQGGVVVVFPEGTRSPDGRIGEMLPGLGGIAKKAGVPIVPTLIDGMVQCWPRSAPLPRPGDVIVEYGTPIGPDQYADWSSERIAQELRRRLTAMQRRWHGRVSERRLQWFNDRACEPEIHETADERR